jgi:thymidylate kinase
MIRRLFRQPKPRFVCIIGIDGAGKSTLAHYMVKELEDGGLRAKYVYGRFQPVLSKLAFVSAKWFLLRSEGPWADYDTLPNRKKHMLKTPILLFLLNLALSIDYFLQLTFKIRLPLLLGENVICDRYIHDTLVTDFALDMDYSADKIAQQIKQWMRVVPNPDTIILLDVPEDIAFKRKDDVPSIDYLSRRRTIYLEVAKRCEATILDGSKSLSDLHSEMRTQVYP